MMYSSYGYSSAASITWIPIVAVILAIVATILAYIFIMPKDKVKNLNKFWYFVHNVFNFKTLLTEKIMKGLYVFMTIYVLLMGVFMIFVQFLAGLLILTLGPIIVRLAYEMLMMFIMLVQNTAAIKNKLYDEVNVPAASQEKKPPKVYVFCSVCGTRYNKLDGRCPGCGQPANPVYNQSNPGNAQPANAFQEHRRYQNPNP